MTMHHSPDVEGIFHLFASGRSNPVYSNYRPQHAVHDNYQTSGNHHYLDGACVYPGESMKVAVWLITPQVYPHCLWEGREIKVLEGARHVGNLRIVQVFNQILRVDPQDFKPLCVEP